MNSFVQGLSNTGKKGQDSGQEKVIRGFVLGSGLGRVKMQGDKWVCMVTNRPFCSCAAGLYTYSATGLESKMPFGAGK